MCIFSLLFLLPLIKLIKAGNVLEEEDEITNNIYILIEKRMPNK